MLPHFLKFFFVVVFTWAFYHYNHYLAIVGFLIALILLKTLTRVFQLRVISTIAQFEFKQAHKLSQFTSGWERNSLSLELEAFSKALLLLDTEADQAKITIEPFFESTVPEISELAIVIFGTYYGFAQVLQWFEQKLPKVDSKMPKIYRLSYLHTLAECREAGRLVDAFTVLFNPMTSFNKDRLGLDAWGFLILFAGVGDAEGTESFANLISANKNHESRIYWIALAHLNQGDTEKAKQLFETARKCKNKKIKLWIENKLATLNSYPAVSLSDEHKRLVLDLKTANAHTASTIKRAKQIGYFVKALMWAILGIIALFVLVIVIVWVS